jgi:purine-nucleoside phosphorylase
VYPRAAKRDYPIFGGMHAPLGYDAIQEATAYLKSKGFISPGTGLIMGTGLSGLASVIRIETEIYYQDIPHFPVSTVESHLGKLVYGTVGSHKVVAMQGRFHFYEGYDMSKIVFPVRVMKFLGIRQLLVSNAAGALNPDFRKGSLMLLDDHINLLPSNPLIGPNDERLGIRFPDMSAPYDRALNERFKKIAGDQGVHLHSGVYAAVPGPNLETRAEYRFLKTIGADAVGMSTIPEVIAARHMGLPCAAISVLTDECDPDHLAETNLADILAAARTAEKPLTGLVRSFLESL